MSASNSNKTHAAAWAIALLIAVPLLYLLSVPPLVRYSETGASMDYMILVRKRALIYPVSPTLYYYCAPYEWLAEHTALKEPLDDYMALWIPPLFIGAPPAVKPRGACHPAHGPTDGCCALKGGIHGTASATRKQPGMTHPISRNHWRRSSEESRALLIARSLASLHLAISKGKSLRVILDTNNRAEARDYSRSSSPILELRSGFLEMISTCAATTRLEHSAWTNVFPPP